MKHFSDPKKKKNKATKPNKTKNKSKTNKKQKQPLTQPNYMYTDNACNWISTHQ